MEQNKNASKSKHRPVGFNLGERKSSKQKSQGFVVRFHHDLKVLWRGYLSSLGGVGLPKFPIVYRRKKIQMENGNARQCFVMLQACSEKRGAMKNLFIDIFQLMINCGKRQFIAWRDLVKQQQSLAWGIRVAGSTPSCSHMHFEADPKLFKQISQQLFARDLLPFPRPINGEEEHKVPLFFAEKTKCHQVSLSSNHLVQFCWSPFSEQMRCLRIMNQETATLLRRSAF